MYDPLLKARARAIERIQEELNIDDVDIAIKGVDMYMDAMEELLSHESKIVRNHETGQLKVLYDGEESNP
jgi:hypothetical protein